MTEINDNYGIPVIIHHENASNPREKSFNLVITNSRVSKNGPMAKAIFLQTV